jgi:hypothetical protein
MAAARDGSTQNDTGSSSTTPYVVVYLPKPPLPSYSKDNLIRMHLANNRSVIIRGQVLEGPTGFTHEDIEAYKGSLSQVVEWQGE